MQDYIPQKIDINGQIGEIVVKQFDNLSRFLNVQITDNDNPESTVFNLTGCVARLFVQVGNAPVYIDGEIADEENGVLSFNLTSGLTQTVGKFPCEIRITNAEEQSIISTRQFTLTVLDSLFDSDALESSPQYSALENALFQIAIDRARLNHLESMAEAGTVIPGTAQAELADIRTGYDGTVYSSAGAAVRGQIDDIYSSIRPATAAEFAAAMGEDIPEQAEEIANDLQNLLDGANGWESRINAVETGLAMTQQNIPALIPNGGITEAMLSGAVKRNGGGLLALECLGDSFIDYRAEALCHNCQGFTADDDYFYLYRAGKLRYDDNDVLQTDKPCGHLQKIDRETLATVAEKDFFPTVSNGVLTGCGLEHGNDMTVITLGGTEYLLAVAGNNLANDAPHFGVWLLRTDNLNIVASTTFSVSEQDEDEESASDKAIYRIAAVKGSNVLFLAHHSIVYRTTVTLSGGVLTVGTPVAQEGIALTGNQGMDCDGARLYCLDAWSRTLEIVSLSDKSVHRLKLETVMQGFIMAEPEGVAVFGDDVYIAGGTNCNSFTGISQTLLCHGNLRTPICAFSKKANIRNLEDPIALFAGKAIVTAATLSGLPATGNASAYYYVGSGSNYTLYRWEKGDNEEYSYQEKESGITSVPDNDSDDGSYDFAYHTGFSGHPFSSVYTAWMAAKSLFLLGFGVQFNLHVNLPIRKNIHLYGGGFSITLTTDLPSIATASAAKLVLHHVDGTVDLSLPALEVIGGQINLTGSIGTLTAREGAVVFTNSSDDFTPADSSYNFLVLGQNAIYTRFGTVAYTPYETEEE